jgi:RNA polymerase sigma factor (sigma-70 family)
MDEAAIKKIVKEVVKETLREMNLVRKRDKNKKSFKDVIELLESIPDLKDKIEQDEMDIADMKQEKFETNTWHNIKRPEGPQLDDSVRHLQKIRNRERAQKRTEKLLQRIENVLDKVKNEDEYEILEMHYFKGMTIEQIAEQLNYSSRTIWRKHNKIVTKLKRKLFGADALDI